MKKLFLIATLPWMSLAADKNWKLPAEAAKLERGPGVEIVTAQCMICHSVDYISTQPRMNRAAWTAAVTKMKEKYGAPVPADQIEKIAEYLVKTYGTERPADLEWK